MFKKKKLYQIKYKSCAYYTVYIEAKNEFQALKKFYKKYGFQICPPEIISFKEQDVRLIGIE